MLGLKTSPSHTHAKLMLSPLVLSPALLRVLWTSKQGQQIQNHDDLLVELRTWAGARQASHACLLGPPHLDDEVANLVRVGWTGPVHRCRDEGGCHIIAENHFLPCLQAPVQLSDVIVLWAGGGERGEEMGHSTAQCPNSWAHGPR